MTCGCSIHRIRRRTPYAAAALQHECLTPDVDRRTAVSSSHLTPLEGDGFEPSVPGCETVNPIVGDGTVCSKTGADLLGNRKFEAISRETSGSEPNCPRLLPPKVRFAIDSPLEEIGFELVVPCRAASRQGPTNCPATIIAVDDQNYLQT